MGGNGYSSITNWLSSDIFGGASDIFGNALGGTDDLLQNLFGGADVTMPPSDYPESIYDLEAGLATVNEQAVSIITDFQNSMTDILGEITGATVPTAPEIIEIEDINWTDKIAEMEDAAYADMEEMAFWGEASGTRITARDVWEREATVTTKQLTGS